VIDHQSVVGAQPYEVLEQFLENNGAKKRPPPSRSVAPKA
jgi:predicted DsbA family dithiol-disulfide isomerase